MPLDRPHSFRDDLRISINAGASPQLPGRLLSADWEFVTLPRDLDVNTTPPRFAAARQSSVPDARIGVAPGWLTMCKHHVMSSGAAG